MNSATTNGTVSFVSDITAPTIAAPTVTAGYFTSLSVPVALGTPTDGGSGVNAGSTIVQRDEALLDNSDGNCDAFPSSWSTVTLTGGNDTTVQSGKCYRYRHLISDNVGNQQTSAVSATREGRHLRPGRSLPDGHRESRRSRPARLGLLALLPARPGRLLQGGGDRERRPVRDQARHLPRARGHHRERKRHDLALRAGLLLDGRDVGLAERLRHRDEQRRPHGHRLDLQRRLRLDRPDRPLGRPRRRPLVHVPLRRPDAEHRLGRRARASTQARP